MSGRVVSPTLKQLVHNLFKSGGFENLQGYQLEGHKCITSVDKRLEREAGGSLLYGEVLPEGVARLLDDDHLSVRTAKVLYDFGMGTGKLCLQVFLEYPHLDQVVGIEISPSRYKIGAQALRRLAQRRGFALLADNEHRCKVLQLLGNRRRILEFRCGDAFATLAERSEHDPHVSFVGAADIILLNTDFPESCHASICELLFRMALGARTASYGDLRKMYLAVQQRQLRAGDSKAANRAFPMVHYPINDDSDRFRTTWSPKLGHHFFLFHRGPFLKKAKV